MSWALLLLPVLVVLYLLQPLFRPGRDERAARESRLDALRQQKRSLLSAIRELDFDREMGKISEADHTAERDRMKREASLVMGRLDSEEGKRHA